MKPAPLPANESQRLARLYSLGVLDTPADPLYDDITRLAAMFCKTLFATITLVDRDRQWFKSRAGLDMEGSDRDSSFCSHAILKDDVMIIEDAHADERFHDNPFVTEGPRIRFYAGAPLITRDGLSLGTLCVFDPRPGTLDNEQKEALQLLARQVVERLERRLNDSLARHVGQILDYSDMYVALIDVQQERVAYTNRGFDLRAGPKDSDARVFMQDLLPELSFDDAIATSDTAETYHEIALETRVRFATTDVLSSQVRLISTREQGRHILLIAIHDRSALRKSQTEAREARSNLRLFSQAAVQSRNLVVITDASERIEWVNPSFEALTGYGLSDVIGRRPGDVLQGPDTSAEARARIRQHLDEGRAVRQEILNYARSGERYWLDVYIEPIRDEQGRITHFVASQTDVTRRREQENAVLESRDAAERANRAKSEFLANMSHELRTPLNGILGVADLLQGSVPDHLRGYIDTLNLSSRHLLRLLNDILDLSHIESGHLKLDSAPFSLIGVLQEVEALFAPRAAESGTRLVMDAGTLQDSYLVGDATRLKQVLMNLVGNAVKFTEQGEIRIEARLIREQGPFCRILLAVSDNGPGIPEADQERIFKHFEQLDNSSSRTHGGTGLGLAICQQILHHMGSRVSLQSAPGKGARFFFELELEKTAAIPVSEQPTVLGSTRLGTTLVVDDNEINQTILKSMLERISSGLVYTAGSARRGLALLDNLQPQMVFVDIQMPGMDGFEFLTNLDEWYRANGLPRPFVVACTAHTGQEHRQRSLERGFDAHLEKPVTRDSLADLLSGMSFSTRARTAPGDALEEALPDNVSNVIDAQAMTQAFGDNKALMRQFLELFLEHYQDHLDQAKDAIAREKPEAGIEAAHTLRGLMGYFGNYQGILDIAADLELALRQSRTPQAQQLLSALQKRMDSLIPAARDALHTLQQGNGAPSG